MSLVHELSAQTPLPSFDIFSVPATQTTVERDNVTEHRPLSTLQSNQPIEFIIPTAYDEYLSPREAIFYLRLHVILKSTTTTAIVADDWKKVTPVNNLLHSLFESIEVHIGDKQINAASSAYPYLAFFDTLINLNKDAITTYLTASLSYKEDATRRSMISADGSDKKIGKSLELAGKLHLDIFNQDKSIIGGSTMKIKMIPHKPTFYLNIEGTSIEAEVEFEEAFLEVHRSKINEAVVIAHNEALKVSPAKYPINRCELKQFSITKGSLDAFIDNAIVGQLPRRLYVGLVKNTAFHGSYKNDPFYFEHANINYIVCHYNSQQFPSKAYKPDFSKNKYIREFLGLYETANQLYGQANLGITRDQYKEGKTIFGFNFAPDLSDDCHKSGYVNLIKRGTLRIEIHFSVPLPETMNVLVYTEFDNIIQIGSERNGIVDYS